ncbi:MAG: MmgE/PrpD family protein [Alphaproteobacteria bacterium]|jgi:2-methylcitrate dehydratase PrpD|nr:MmgE/PrpD family protein [Alphaproteobacteria bacterium]
MGPDRRAIAFIREAGSAEIPPDIKERALAAVIDLVAVALGGCRTEMAGVARRFALDQLQPGPEGPSARLLFDGRRASPVGAAFANAAMIDSLDAHDGHAGPMGHAGVALLPTLLALSDAAGSESGRGSVPLSGPDLLAALVIGYEVGLRAGLALTRNGVEAWGSGAWNAIGGAAIGARLRGLDPDRTWDALGLAEFNAPRSPVARSVAHPTMVKDGAAPAAAAGIGAVFLAEAGFTGAPCGLIADPDHAGLWETLGTHWEMRALNTKELPIIRWAEPAVRAALALADGRRLHAETISRIEVATFAAAGRLGLPEPQTSEQAQYSLAFPVAVALVHGSVGPEHLSGSALHDPSVVRLSRLVSVRHDPAYDAAYPVEQIARVTITLQDGRAQTACHALPAATPPLTRTAAVAKLRRYGAGVLSGEDLRAIETGLLSLPGAPAGTGLAPLYLEVAATHAGGERRCGGVSGP